MKANNSPITKLIDFGRKTYYYCTEDVWSDTRQSWFVNLVKTLNLSVRSFLNADLQTRAASLTFNSLLAIVPALALIFAIGRGFGFRNLLESQLFQYFPSQQEALKAAFVFVENYLAQASEGLFVGIGIVFLLWTLISLFGNVENSFNAVWNVKKGRSIGRKLTDYTAIMLLLPILMICSSGISIFMSTSLQNALPFAFISPAVSTLLDFAPFVLTWFFYTGVYILFPNTKVKLKNAFIAGIVSGTAFQVLQWLFVSGQLYVSKYNAIYGSFAFLPLLLIWLDLVWLITLAGAVICYSSQNIFQFNFANDIKTISYNYRRKVSIVLITVAIKRFVVGLEPYTIADFSARYRMPSRLVSELLNELVDTGLLSIVLAKDETFAYQPAISTDSLTVGFVLDRLNQQGSDNFIPDFNNHFSSILSAIDKIIDPIENGTSKDLLIKEINIDL